MSLIVLAALTSNSLLAPVSTAEANAQAFLQKVGVKGARLVSTRDFRGRGTAFRFGASGKEYTVVIASDSKRVLSMRDRSGMEAPAKCDPQKALSLAKTKIQQLVPRKDVILSLETAGGIAKASYDLNVGGYPVWESGYRIQFDAQSGRIISYQDSCESVNPDITKPKVTAKQALVAAQAYAKRRAAANRFALVPVKITFPTQTPSLGFLTGETGAQLMYRFENVKYPVKPNVPGIQNPAVFSVYVSARTGLVMERSIKAAHAPMSRAN